MLFAFLNRIVRCHLNKTVKAQSVNYRDFCREKKSRREGTYCVSAPRQKEVCLAWAGNNKEASVEARNNNK